MGRRRSVNRAFAEGMLLVVAIAAAGVCDAVAIREGRDGRRATTRDLWRDSPLLLAGLAATVFGLGLASRWTVESVLDAQDAAGREDDDDEGA